MGWSCPAVSGCGAGAHLPAGLEEATAQDGGWPCACQGSASLPSLWLCGSAFRDTGLAGAGTQGKCCASWKGVEGHREMRGLAGAGFMIGAGRKGTVSRGEGSLHLLEGDDGTGWGGLNAHKAGFQGGKPSCRERAAFCGSLGLQESCTGLRQVSLAVLPFPLCLGSPKHSLVPLHNAGAVWVSSSGGNFEVQRHFDCGGLKRCRARPLQGLSTGPPAFAGEKKSLTLQPLQPSAPASNARSPKTERRWGLRQTTS